MPQEPRPGVRTLIVIGLAIYAYCSRKEHGPKTSKWVIVGGGVVLPVVVLSGRDKGRQGQVLQVVGGGTHVVVENVNKDVVKKGALAQNIALQPGDTVVVP